MRKSILSILCILLIFPLGSCAIIAGTIDSVRRVGITAADRQSLLNPAVKKFNEALAWGDLNSALSMVTEEYRVTLRDQLLRDKDKVKIMETAVDLAEFDDSSYKATVYVSLKAYTVPYYVVEAVKQKQIWEFSTAGGGWRLSNREPLEKNT